MLHTPDNYQKRLKNNSLFFSWYSQLARWLWFGDSDEKNDLTEVTCLCETFGEDYASLCFFNCCLNKAYCSGLSHCR